MYQNVVVGKPLVAPSVIFATDEIDWQDIEQPNTLFTEQRSLPHIMKEAGVVQSISEVRRNRPDLCVMLDKQDFITIKWGKKFLFVLIGE